MPDISLRVTMFAFLEVRDIVFGEQSKMVVNPGEEQLKSQFGGVSRTYIPIHSVVRVDEVEKEDQQRCTQLARRVLSHLSQCRSNRLKEF